MLAKNDKVEFQFRQIWAYFNVNEKKNFFGYAENFG